MCWISVRVVLACCYLPAFVVAVGDELEVDLPDELDEGATYRVKVAWIRSHDLFAEVGVMKLINEFV